MYRLTKEFRFEASHQLIKHDGKCARLHGHSWIFEVEVVGFTFLGGPKENMVMDYGDISAVVKPVIEEYLDHHHLNETLNEEMPTSEFIAKWLWDRLRNLLPLSAITVRETCTSACRYEGE